MKTTLNNQQIALQVINKIQETPQTVTLVLKPLSQNVPYKAGQFLTIILNINQQEIQRFYSLSSAPHSDDLLAITVKKIPNGIASKYLTETIKVGDQLATLPAAGQFILPKSETVVVLISGGSGITPLFSILKEVLTTSSKNVYLINANRNRKQIIFKTALHDWAKKYSNRLTILHFLSRPTEPLSSPIANETFKEGYLSNFRIERLVKKYTSISPNPHFYICGPEGIMLKSRMTINFMGFPKANIHQEAFIIKEISKPDPKHFSDSEVTYIYADNQAVKFPVQAGQTILDAAYQADISLPFNCKSGICTVCSAQCKSGKAEMYTTEGKFDTDNMKGITFTCVSYPLTNTITLYSDALQSLPQKQ